MRSTTWWRARTGDGGARALTRRSTPRPAATRRPEGTTLTVLRSAGGVFGISLASVPAGSGQAASGGNVALVADSVIPTAWTAVLHWRAPAAGGSGDAAFGTEGQPGFDPRTRTRSGPVIRPPKSRGRGWRDQLRAQPRGPGRAAGASDHRWHHIHGDRDRDHGADCQGRATTWSAPL